MRVVLIHGMAGSGDSTWRANGWLDVLADEGHDPVAPDLLGHGSTARPHDPAAYAHLADPIDAELDAAASTPVALVGFSLGARLSIETALRRPDDVAALVLLGVGAGLFASWDHEPLAAALAGAADPSDPEHAAVAQHPFVAHLRALAQDHSDPLALAALVRHRGTDAVDPDALATLDIPSLVVVGAEDPVGPAAPLASALRGRGVMVPRCDHFALPRRFEAIEATVDFLRQASSASASSAQGPGF